MCAGWSARRGVCSASSSQRLRCSGASRPWIWVSSHLWELARLPSHLSRGGAGSRELCQAQGLFCFLKLVKCRCTRGGWCQKPGAHHPAPLPPCVFSWISAAFLSSPVRPRLPIKSSQLLSGIAKCFYSSYRKMQITTTLEVQKKCFVVGQDGFEVSASESRKGALLLWFYYFMLSGALSGHSML